MTTGAVWHRSVDVGWGVVHARTGECHTGEPVVLLHQTPRSGDEFAEVIAGLGSGHRLIALDLPGMGHSSPHPDGDSIVTAARAIADTLDALGVGRCVVVGHHTGAAVAAELAARHPRRTSHLVLSSPPWIDADVRAARLARQRPGVDDVERNAAGDHLGSLWSGRAWFYPPDRPDLLDRFVSDALLVADPTAGHRAVTDWQMDATIDVLRTIDTTLVDHVADPHAHPNIERWAAALEHARVEVIEEGMVPLEYTADAFVAVLRRILAR